MHSPEAGRSDLPVTVLLLAAQRAGVVNPLAEKAGTSHKCLVPIGGDPLIVHVVRTLTEIPGIERIRISLEPEAHKAVAAELQPFAACGVPIEFVPSSPNIVDSTIAAAGDGEGPFVVTTADNVLLTGEGFDKLREALRQADGAIGVTRKEHVLAAHPEGQRNFYQFRDGGYANCNIYGLADRAAFSAAEIFREGGQFQAHLGRMVRAFGLFNILLMRSGMITLPQAFQRLSRRFAMRIDPVVFDDGALAIDVDNDRTYACAETIMLRRRGIAGVHS